MQAGHESARGPMHSITRRRLKEFWDRHPDAEIPLKAWLSIGRRKRYADPHELRLDFPSASLLGGGRTVFNIAGNKYRLVVIIRYDMARVFVRHMLTHEEYQRRSREGTL